MPLTFDDFLMLAPLCIMQFLFPNNCSRYFFPHQKFSSNSVCFHLLICCTLASSASASEPKKQNSLDGVTVQALDKELEMMQLATNLRLQTAPQSQWRERRWFAYSVTNQTLTIIGALMNGCGRIHYRNMPGKAPKNLFVNATWIRFVANAVSVVGSAAEAAIDLSKQRIDKRAGIDLATYIKYATKNLSLIDAALLQRGQLVAHEENIGIRDLLNRENKILNDMRECCADDLEEAYIRAKSVRASRYFQYSWVGLSNAAGGAGTLANNIAAINDKPLRLTWAGGVGDVISGSMNMITPELVDDAGYLAARAAGHPLTKELSFSSKASLLTKFDADLQNFHSSILSSSNISDGVALRQNVYDVEKNILDQRFSSRPKPPKGTVGRVVGNFGSAVGGAGKLSNGVETLVGNFKYTKNGHQRFENLGGGGIVYGAGTAVAEEETVRREVISEMTWHRLPKEKRLAQILKAQLALLDKARADLKAGP
jgi:hypothetical protein